MIQGTPITTTMRGLTPDTLAHWRYQIGDHNGRPAQIANHVIDGQISGQKLRYAGKQFAVLGKMASLYGMWLWPSKGKRVVVTEGELDALSVSQVQGNTWPVVSVPNGAQGAEKAFRQAIEFLSGYDEVVIMFDMDDPGQKAAIECAKLLPPGRAKIATLPLKDASEMLQAGREKELVSAIWNAAEYRPDGVVSLGELKSKVLAPIKRGAPWCYETLDNLTFGRRLGEVVFIGAGTGVGKTDLLAQQIEFDLRVLEENVGGLFLESIPKDTATRIIGKFAGKRFHVPDGSWTATELHDAYDALTALNGRLYLYDNFGATEWDDVADRIRYMALHCGCKYIYLDHLTALAAAADDERVALEKITAELAGLAMQLNVWLCVVSHLATPEKGSHEEGARVTIRQFKGSRAIGFWAHFMIGLERDQQAEGPASKITTVRILKDRYTGQATGKTFAITYDENTGRLNECAFPESPSSPQQGSDF